MKKNISFVRGLSLVDEARALKMLRSGATQSSVAIIFGVTKNTISGIWSRRGDPKRESMTTYDRLNALDVVLDRVLADTRNIERIPNKPKLKVVR